MTTASELVAALPGIVWEADGTDYRMTYVSPRAHDLVGHDPAVWLAVPSFWEDHLHPDDRDRAMGGAQEAIASMGSATLDYRFRDAWGGYRWFRDFIRVVEHADGHRHLVGFMVDVDAEASADEARRILAAAVDGAAESVVVTEADGTIIYVNPAFETVTGYRRDEVVGQNPRVLKSGEHPPEFYEQMWATLSAGKRWAGEIINRRRDGSRSIEEASITAVEDPRSGRRRYLAVKRDVTAERDERAAFDWLAAAVQSARDAVYAVSTDGVFLAWNDAATRLYGWRADEVLGRSSFDVVVPEEHDSIRRWIARVSAGEAVGPVDVVQRGEGGRALTLAVIATPARDRHGTVTGVATVARDISVEHQAALERAALEAQLRQAQRMDAIGRLAGAIAHDFNNLLTVIGGYADVAADQLTGPVREDVLEIRRAADRASDLTRRLLAFARAGEVVEQRLDLDAALGESAHLVGRLVPERISFAFEASSGITVLADPGEIDQILVNLVVNAVDAIDGTGTIDVRCARDDDGRTAVISVRDTGGGIDPVTLERIFEPFFTTKSEGRGTGLGLATVFAIAQRAGGSVDVSSSVGQGTTFRVTLPAAGEGGMPAADEPRPAWEPAGGGHVLVVEDDPALRVLATRMLSQLGFAVTSASWGQEALGVDLHGIDAIVCDVVMPGMSGPELLRRLVDPPPTVFVSGYTHDDLKEMPDSRWVFLAKPYTHESLAAALRSALDGAPATAE